MELVKHNSDRTQALTQSEQQSLVWLAGLMASTKARYPNQEITAETAQAWLEDWKLMVQQYGADRFKRGLRAAVMASKFFPGPAEIAEHMPEPEPIGTLADKDCSLCSGTGWKQVQGDAGKLKVGRCDCWIRNRGKLETA